MAEGRWVGKGVTGPAMPANVVIDLSTPRADGGGAMCRVKARTRALPIVDPSANITAMLAPQVAG